MTRESRKSTSKLSKKSITSTTALLAYLAVADFAVHMIFAGNYGYFRDELYYVVSGTQHLSLGYVDFPPLIAYVAALLYPVSKDSVVSIHVVPALVESLLVFVTGMIARELRRRKGESSFSLRFQPWSRSIFLHLVRCLPRTRSIRCGGPC